MKRPPTIGVIIPFYGGGDSFWDELTDSLVKQTRKLDEAVIVLDGRDQSLPEKDIAGIASKVRLVQHTENRGVAEARNTGLAASGTDYLFFLDQDDLWYPGRVQAFCDRIEKERPDFISSGYDMVDEAGRIIRRVEVGDWTASPKRTERLEGQFAARTGGLAINALCCRRERSPLFDPALGSSDDFLYLFEVLDDGPVTLIGRSTGGRRFHGENRSLSRGHILGRIRAVHLVRHRFGLSPRAQRRGIADLLTSRGAEHLVTGDYRRAAVCFRRAARVDRRHRRALAGWLACRISKNPAALINRSKSLLWRAGLSNAVGLVGQASKKRRESR